MRPVAIVEIMLRPDGRPPSDLIRTIYRASEGGQYICALRGVDWHMMNKVLDPLVATMPLTIPGILYVDIENESAIRQAILSTDLMLAISSQFRAMGEALGFQRHAGTMIVPGFYRLVGPLAATGGNSPDRPQVPDCAYEFATSR